MTSFSNSTFWDAVGTQYRNNARLSFELQFRTVKKRLDIELNTQKEVYNNIDKNPSPLLAELKKEREQVDAKRKEVVAYLDPARSSVKRMDSLIRDFMPNLSTAAADTGPDAEKNFNALRNRLNDQLSSFAPAKYFQEGMLDLTSKFKTLPNPSGIKDYADYLGVSDRSAAVGHVIVYPTDDQEVITSLSSGLAMSLGQLRSKMLRDFDRANSILGKSDPKLDGSGNPVLDSQGQPVTVPVSGLVLRLDNLDKRIEKIDAEDRLTVLKQVQTMEKRHDSLLQTLSLSFEFSMGNADIFASRASFSQPQKGSIMNLFI